jgi:hypothetical protein
MEKEEVMSRPKKIQNSPPKEEKIQISEQEVWDVLTFAAGIYGGGGLNPLLVSQQLKSITMNPLQATSDGVTDALLDPKNHETQLVGYSQFFDLSSMLYKRIVQYMAGMLSFDFTYTCINATSKDYKSAAYQKDLQAVKDFFDNMNIKEQFRTAMKQMVRQESFFAFFREDGEKFVFQELPENRCMLTGHWERGLTYDFDMYHFLQPGVDINLYPPIFQKMWDKSFGNKKPSEMYNPATGIDTRDSSWIYWVQTSPAKGFWCFKFSPELATKVPFLAPMFPDVVLQPVMRTLQTNMYIAAASKLLVGKVPMLNKETKAAVKDAVAITPDLLGKFLALLKAGLGDIVKVGASPLEDMQGIEFAGSESRFYQDYMRSTSSTSGINSRLIFSLDKPNAIESQLSVNVDEYLLFPLYTQFENFLDYQINKRTKKFKFSIKLEGSEFFTNRKERLDKQLSLLPFGIIMPQKIAAAISMSPFDFIRHLEESKAMGFTDMLTPIQTAFQTAGDNGDKKAGAPKKSDSDLSDSGAETRANATNEDSEGEQ